MTEVPLPAPGVVFDGAFARRLEGLHLRLKGSAERREGAGVGAGAGGGLEFAGYRPYRPGEDLRRLDWNLLGRLDRPFVRIARRESSERWAVLVDTSASMGVGSPGKLQWAAEVTAGLAAVGLDAGASVLVVPSGDAEPTLLRRKAELWPWMERAQEWRASGRRGAEELLDRARLRGVERVFAIGDWIAIEPPVLYRVFARGRELCVLQVLAQDEVAPPAETLGDSVEWWGAEDGERVAVPLSVEVVGDYERRVEAELERWHAFCSRHRLGYSFWTSDAAFEDAVVAALGE